MRTYTVEVKLATPVPSKRKGIKLIGLVFEGVTSTRRNRIMERHQGDTVTSTVDSK